MVHRPGENRRLRPSNDTGHLVRNLPALDHRNVNDDRQHDRQDVSEPASASLRHRGRNHAGNVPCSVAGLTLPPPSDTLPTSSGMDACGTGGSDMIKTSVGKPAAVSPANAPLPRTEPEAVGMSSTRLGRIITALDTEIEAGRLPGAVVAVARHGRLVFHE